MNESRRMEMINQFMDSFSENIIGFNNTVFDAMQSLNSELENVQNNAQVPYREPANFDKFKKKYKQEFFEEQYRRQAERNQEVEASTNSINNRIDAVKRSASLGVNEIITESSRELESMRTFRNRMQAELDDLQSELSAKKQQFSEIVHNDSLSMEERHNAIEALREPGLNARIEELTGRIAAIDAFSNEVEKLSSLDVEDTEKIEDTLFEVAQNLGDQTKTRAESKGAPEVQEEVAPEVAPEVTPQEVAPEAAPETVAPEAVTNPNEQTAPEVVEEMDEEQIRRRMAELMGLSYDEFVNREIKYEVSNPGKNYINDIYPHDIEYQMDDWAVDEFNDLRDKLHQIKGTKVAEENQVSNRIDEIRKRMGELLGIPPFEGIENENEHAINYQMDDWAIDEFQELRDELKNLLNEQKTNTSQATPVAPVPPVSDEPVEAQENAQTPAAPAEPTEDNNELEKANNEVIENISERDFSTDAPGLNFNAKKTANTNAKRVIGKRKAGIAMVLGGATLAGIAATTLFGVPIATAVLCGASVLGTAEVLDTLSRVTREKIVTRNLDKFAKKMGLEVVYDYDAGTVDFAKAVKNGDKYEYIPVKDVKTMYEIAASRGLSEEQTNELFRKCTRKPASNPFSAMARGVKDLFVENKSGKDISIIGLTGTNAYQNGLADLYSEFGGIRIADPEIEQEEIDKVVEEAKNAGMDKIDQNIEKLEYIRENSTKYNLTEAQIALIDEAIENQNSVKRNAGYRAKNFLKNMPIVNSIKNIKNRLIAGRSERLEDENELENPETPVVTQAENEETSAVTQTETEETPVVTQAEAEEIVENAPVAQEEVPVEAEEVVEPTPEVEEAPTQAAPAEPAPEAPSSTDPLDEINTQISDDIRRLLEEDSLISDDEEKEKAEAEAQVAATQQAEEAVLGSEVTEVQETNTNVVNPEFVEQLSQAPDQTSVDMMVEQMREANVPEEAIEAALNQAGQAPQQDQGKTLGL